MATKIEYKKYILPIGGALAGAGIGFAIAKKHNKRKLGYSIAGGVVVLGVVFLVNHMMEKTSGEKTSGFTLSGLFGGGIKYTNISLLCRTR